MKKRGRLRKGLAVLLTATMVVGLMPGAGTIKVSAAEGEASGSVATAEGYDENGFCTSYELTNGTWALKSGVTACATHGETCKGYQPAVEELLDFLRVVVAADELHRLRSVRLRHGIGRNDPPLHR